MSVYLAVLKDSLREASASWVMWIVLGVVSLGLILLAGLQLRDDVPWRLERADIRNPQVLIERLQERSPRGRHAAVLHIWQQLSPELRQELAALDDQAEPDRYRRTIGRLREQLNDRMDAPDFYDADAWSSVGIGGEARAVLEHQDVAGDPNARRRFHRLVLDAAFPDAVKPVGDSAITVRWMVWTLADQRGITRSDLREIVNQQVLPTVVNWTLGFGGVFVAILVTARLIPQTFESGEIDLLLSKPVARPLLFLTKFFGGSMFILVVSTYAICGVWLILGWRLGLWNNRLLLCIPIFLFLFSIYYSVSAYVGVVWRSAIAAVIVTILFWGCCLAVGLTRNLIDLFALNPERIAVILPTPQGLLATDKSGDILSWNPNRSTWETVIAHESANSRGPQMGLTYPMLGPVYDDANQRLVAVEFEGFRGLQRIGGDGRLFVATQDRGWQRYPSIPAYPGTAAVFVDASGQILTVGEQGVQEFQGDPTIGQRPFRIAGFDLARFARRKEAGHFEPRGPQEDVDWQMPVAADLCPQSRRIVISTGNHVDLLEPNADGNYETTRTRTYPADDPRLVGCGAEWILVAQENGRIDLLSIDTLEIIASWTPYPKSAPQQISVAPHGRFFAVHFHRGFVWMLDAGDQRGFEPDIAGQGKLSAAAFGADGAFYAADRVNRISKYAVPDLRLLERYTPPSEPLHRAYRFLIDPVYTIFPKPSELDSLVQYVLTQESAAAIPGSERDLQRERQVIRVVPIVLSNLAFVLVMLTLSSVRVWRQDF